MSRSSYHGHRFNVELASLKSYESLLVLAMHGTTTLISWNAYLEPLKNILFFAASS